LFNLWIFFKVYYPVVLFIGGLINKKKIEKHLINKNNELILKNIDKNNLKTILLLLSHCLQFNECKQNLTNTILNCVKCGRCDMCKIVELAKKYNIEIKIATGSKLAKKFVELIKPDIVVAVACETELIQGIYAVYPVNVYAIANERPSGPCINTKVNVNTIENFLTIFENHKINKTGV